MAPTMVSIENLAIAVVMDVSPEGVRSGVAVVRMKVCESAFIQE
jgi:hypothetical protein